MIGSLSVAVPGAPGDGRKDHDKEQEKDAGDFEPQNSSDALKRAKESSHAASHSARCASRRLRGGAAPGCRICGDGIPSGRITGSRRIRRCLGGPGNFLPDNASGYAQPDAQGTANGVWLHSLLKW